GFSCDQSTLPPLRARLAVASSYRRGACHAAGRADHDRAGSTAAVQGNRRGIVLISRRECRQRYTTNARIRDAILDGTLPPGASLPSSRSLAAQLSTARGTIELAYTLLAGEDYILGRTPSGPVVNPRLSHLLTPGGQRALRRKFTVPR